MRRRRRPVGYDGFLESDYLIWHVARQRRIEIREAADGDTGHKAVGNLSLIAALVTAHQQHTAMLCNAAQTFSDGVAIHQHVVVVLEEEHTDNLDTVPPFLELRENHLGEYIGDVVALGGEYVGDFH
jgi:hypothetical protein